MSDKYNGWTNYQTWVTNLWMDQEYYCEMAKDSESIGALADFIKDDIEDGMPEVTGVFADLMQYAFDKINWFEISEHIFESAGIDQ